MYRISVREFDEIAEIYCMLAEKCTMALRQFYFDIKENCEKCRYKPMVDFTNQIVEFYFGDFRSHLFRAFNDWENGDYSLDNLTRRIGAGEEAASKGKQCMVRIRGALERMFIDAGLEELHLDTSEPEIDNDTILRNNEYIQTFLRNAEGALYDATSKVETRASENDAFDCIIGIVQTTGNSMIESFREMLAQVNRGEELFDTGSRSSIEPAKSDRGSAMSSDGRMYWPFEGKFI